MKMNKREQGKYMHAYVYLCRYLVIPSLLVVEYDSRPKASSWVDASAGDRDGGQVNYEHRKPNWKWCQHLHI